MKVVPTAKKIRCFLFLHTPPEGTYVTTTQLRTGLDLPEEPVTHYGPVLASAHGCVQNQPTKGKAPCPTLETRLLRVMIPCVIRQSSSTRSGSIPYRFPLTSRCWHEQDRTLITDNSASPMSPLLSMRCVFYRIPRIARKDHGILTLYPVMWV